MMYYYCTPLTAVSCTLLSLSALIAAAQPQNSESIPGQSAYTATAGFPTSAFSSYYIPPLATQEPQPALYDPVLNITFPLNLTNPKTIPTSDDDQVYYPKPVANVSDAAATTIVQSAIADIIAIIGDTGISGNCSKCLAALSVAKLAAQVAPSKVPDAMVGLCQKYQFASNASCADDYAAGSFGAIWTQVLAFADVSGLDGRYICNDLSKTFCPLPTTLPLNLTGLFPKSKPANATAPKASGERVKVLHLSDFHIDPRYSAGSEANCSSFCCRANVHATGLGAGQISLPAPLYGSFKCDTPYYLALAVLQAIAPLTGTQKDKSQIAWTIYTGDLVSHDSQNQLSRAYTGSSPIFLKYWHLYMCMLRPFLQQSMQKQACLACSMNTLAGQYLLPLVTMTVTPKLLTRLIVCLDLLVSSKVGITTMSQGSGNRMAGLTLLRPIRQELITGPILFKIIMAFVS